MSHDFPRRSMFTSGFITLRETFEISLVLVIVLAVLDRAEGKRFHRALWAGVVSGIVVSCLTVVAAWVTLSLVSESTVEIVEKFFVFSAAGLMLWMVVWMNRHGRSLRGKIQGEVQSHLHAGSALGIFFLALTTTAREGIEMAFFLSAVASPLTHFSLFAGSAIGIVVAVLISVLLRRGIQIIPMKYFFAGTSVVLVVTAVHLVLETVV